MKSQEIGGELGKRLLGWVAETMPDPLAAQKRRMGSPSSLDDFDRAYVRDQFLQRMRIGMGMGEHFPDVLGKRVLEIGCGHGGITAFLAAVGAKSAVGIDVNAAHLEHGRRFVDEIAKGGLEHVRDATRFDVMDCHQLTFAPASFDVVVADNLFEHVDDPGRVLAECARVLDARGVVVVPTFSSIWSKHGLHLKNGLKVPWANLVFSEETIVEVVKERATKNPALYEMYPGLRSGAQTVRDLRKHRDLNTMTHARFIELADAAGFEVEYFRVHVTPVGRVVAKALGWPCEGPDAARNEALEVMSTGAAAALRKRA